MKTVIIDCGHGGIDNKGNYTTAPKKMFKFPNGEIAYEGELNRKLGKELGDYLKKHYNIYYTVHPDNFTDIPLNIRTKIVNSFPITDTVLISLHSNASSSHTARGFEVFTSIGETKADKLATFIGNEIIKSFPNNRFRKDISDGDIDKESQFYILRSSNCPAVLIENLFFDNYEDYKLLINKDFRDKLAYSIFKGIRKYF